MGDFDRNDIFRVASWRAAAEGSAKPGVGTVLHTGGDADQRVVVDEHERLHMELNGCSSFGLLLSLVGQGGGGLPERERDELLETLIALCRVPHEVYATTLSVSAVPAERRDQVLADYPDYEEFFDPGRSLCDGYPLDSMIATALLVAGCVAAMQVPLHLLLGTTEDWLTDPLEAAPAHCPSCRFAAVLEIAESAALEFDWIEREVDPAWLVRTVPDPYGSPEYKRAYHLALIRAYHQYAWALGLRGIPVLPWDGHLRYGTVPVHSAAVGAGRFDRQHLSPAEAQALEAATAAASNVHNAIRSSERQSLRRATFGMTAAVVSFADVLAHPQPGLDLGTFLRPEATNIGVHLVARPVEAVIASYSMSDEHAAMAHAAATGGVLTAVRAAGDLNGAWLTILAAMSSKEDLIALVRALLADPGIPPGIVSSIARSCLFSRAWGNEWLTGLRYVSMPLLLEDLPPSLFLAAECDPDGFRFATFRFDDAKPGVPGFDPLHAVLIDRNRAAGTIERFLAFMGSCVLIDNFAMRLGDLPGAKPDASLAGSPAVHAMRHLATEEPQFHFRGYEHIAPTELAEPEVELAEFDRWHELNQRLLARQRILER